MSSLNVLHTQIDSGSFKTDDYSFLPEVEVPAGNAVNKDTNHHNNDDFNFTNMQSALTETATSDSSVEVHVQISELIKENNRLKEMLSKNDSKVEENLKKAKERISSLENDYSELHKEVIELRKKEKEPVESCLKCTRSEAALNFMLGMDYIEENEHLILEWSYFRENLTGNLNYIIRHLEDISKSKKTWEEKILFDCYILMLKFKISFLKENIESTQFASLRTDEETGFEIIRLKTYEPPLMAMEGLKKEVKDKQQEITDLKKEREDFVEKIKTYELKIQECEAVLKSQCELLNDKLLIESSLPEHYKERCKHLEKQIKDFPAKLEQNAKISDDKITQEHKQEIQNLKQNFKPEQESNKKDKEKLSEIMIKYEKIQVDYDRVVKLLEIQLKDEKEKSQELTLRENDAKRYMEDADHLTAKLLEAQEQLEDRNAEIRKLQNQLAEVNEKKSHSSTNQDRRSDQKRENKHGGATETILCPICSKGFTNERAVQNHIIRCLEETA